MEFETIHTEDLPSDWVIRLTIIDMELLPLEGIEVGKVNHYKLLVYTLNDAKYYNHVLIIHLIQLIIRRQTSTLFQYAR